MNRKQFSCIVEQEIVLIYTYVELLCVSLHQL